MVTNGRNWFSPALSRGAGSTLLRSAVLLGAFSVIASAQTAVNCSSAAATTNPIRAEGKTEQIGDYIFLCTNASASPITATSITATISVPVTSKVLNASTGITEAAVVVTDPTGLVSTYLGTVSGSVVTFANVVIAPSPTVANSLVPSSFEITNIRVDATTFGISASPQTVTEQVVVNGTNISSSALITTNSSTVLSGLGTQSLTGTQTFPVCSTISAAAPAFTVKFGEGVIPNSFKIQGNVDYDTGFGSWLSNNTESGYYVTTGVGNLVLSNTANSATRLRVIFSNVPANVSIYVPTNMATDLNATSGLPYGTLALTTTESGAFSQVPAAANPPGYTGSASLGLAINLGSGSWEAVYEVQSQTVNTVETYSVPVYVGTSGTVTGSATAITAAVSYAPVGAASNIPNFTQLSSTTTLTGSTFPTCPSFTTGTTLPLGEVGAAYSQTIGVTGGTTPYTWGFATGSGPLPTGLALNSATGAITGVISGAASFYSFTINVTDQNGTLITRTFGLTVNSGVSITASTPPTGALSETYSFAPSATGGFAPYSTWSISAGTFPSGLQFNTSTGLISGTPTAANSFSFTLKVIDSAGFSAIRAFTIVIYGPLTITTTAIPVAVQGTVYANFGLAPSGGVGGYSWALVPATALNGTGLSFSSSGVLSGTATTSGTFPITFQLSDQATGVTTKALSVQINPPLAVPGQSLVTGVQGVAYSQQLQATGGAGGNSWLLFSGTLPNGVTIGGGGLLSGTPTQSGAFPFTPRVTDAYGDFVQNVPLTLQVNAPVSISTSVLPNTYAGLAYNQTVSATGGLGSYTWSISAGALPSPLTINSSTGAITGTPATAGTYTFTVQVVDSSTSTATQQFTITVNPAVTFNFISGVLGTSPLAYFRLESPSGTSLVGNYAYNFSASGAGVITGAPLGSGVANNAVALNGVTGAVTTSLSGGITTAGTIMAWINLTQLPSLTGHVNYIAGESQIGNDFDLQIETDNAIHFYTTNNAQSILYAPSTNGLAGVWHLVVATFDNTAGKRVIYWDGVPVASDTTQSISNKTFAFNIGESQVFTGRYFNGGIDEVGVWNVALSPLQVAQLYDIPRQLFPAGAINSAYGPLTIAVAGGSGSYTWSPASGLPTGLALGAAGVLSGTPTASGTFASIQLNVTDTVTSQSSLLVYGMTINPALAITPTSLPAGIQSSLYNQQLSATGGTGAGYSWQTAPASTLPAGLTLTTAGLLSGTPTVAGSFTFSVVVTDSGGATGQQAYTLVINAAGAIITTNLPAGMAIINISGTANGGFTYNGAQTIWYQPFTVPAGQPVAYTFQPGTYTFRVIDSTDALTVFPNLTTAQQSSIYTAWTYNSPYTDGYLAFDSSALSNGLEGQLFSGGDINALVYTPQAAYALALSSGSYHQVAVGARNATPQNTYTFTSPQTLIFAVPDNILSDNAGGVSVLVAPAAAPLSITSGSPPAGTLSVNYGPYVLTAAGGSGTYVWSATGLPTGVTLSAGGILSGLPSVLGPFASAVVTVTDPVSGLFASQTYSITISAAAAPLVITTTSLPVAVAFSAYSQTLTASGGTGALTWSISTGSLPYPLILNPSTGAITGTQSTTGSSTFTVKVTDSLGAFATQQLTLTTNGQLTITSTTLPGATQGTPYNQTLTVTGGSGTGYSFTVTAGTVTQAGLALASTGALTGTPTTSGNLVLTVQATDSYSDSTTQPVTLPIAPISTSPWNYAVVNAATNIVSVTPAGGAGSTICAGAACHPYDIASDAAGNIYSHDQTGLVKLSPSGTVLWTVPLSGGFGGVALDALGNVIFVDNTNDAVYRVKTDGTGLTQVAPFPILSPNQAQNTYVAVDQGFDSNYTGDYIVVSDDGGAVKMWRFTPAGAVTTVATFQGSRNSGLVIDLQENYVFLDNSVNAIVKVNPTSGLSTTVVSGTALCSGCSAFGLTVDPVSGDYIAGIGGVLLRVTSAGAVTRIASGGALFRAVSIAPIPATPPVRLTISPLTLRSANTGFSYGPINFTAAGGSGNYTWSATGLPSGWTMTTGGVLSGITFSASTYAIVVTVTDTTTNQSASANYTVLVTVPAPPPPPPLQISGSVGTINTIVGGTVAASFTASGGTVPYTFSATGLPAGVTLSSAGVLGGAPTQAGNSTASVTVRDAGFSSASASITINVLGITSGTLTPGTTGVVYAATIGAAGGTQPYTFTASGLPSGLTLSPGGALGGTVKTAGTYTFTVKVTDGAGSGASGTFTVAFAQPAKLAVSGGLPDGPVSTLYSGQIGVTGGVPPYTVSLSNGVIPAGLSLNSSGILSGTPVGPGTFTFGILVADSTGGTLLSTITINVKAAPVTITTSSPLPPGMSTVDYPPQQFSATGGLGDYVWSLSGGSLPAGMTLGGDGTLSGTPGATAAAQSPYSFTVTATDSNKATGSATFALTIRPFAADIELSSGSLSFSLNAPSVTLPDPQSVGVQSTQASQQLAFSVAVNPSAPWLAVTSGAQTPSALSVGLTGAALALGAGNYSTSITVTCGTAPCSGHTQSVAVSLHVVNTPPQLQVLSDELDFGTTSSSPSPVSQTLTIENAGGGTLGIGSVVCEAPWCTVSGVPGTLSGGAVAALFVTVNPSITGNGFFRTQVDVVTSAGRASVPVTLFAATNASITLAPSGAEFIMPVGGAPGNSKGSFLVSTNSQTPVSWTASIQPGAPWLLPGVMAGTSSATQSGSATFSIDPVAAGNLTPGAYYGRIEVSASNVSDSPLDFIVVLSVTPATTSVKPDPEPAGLLFLTSVGLNPPAQTVNVYSGSVAPLPFQANPAGGAWLSVSPVTGTAALNSPGVTTVSVDVTGLKAGVYSAGVTYAFGSAGVRTVNVTLIVSSGLGGAATGTTSKDATTTLSSVLPGAYKPLASGCTPAALAPAQTGLVNNFSAPASWPTPLAIVLSDDCGSPVNSGQIVATFSNGDAPLVLSLVDPAHGLYSGTWTPRKSSPQITINARATAPGLPAATVSLAGAITPNAAPSLTPHGTLGSFTPLVGTSVAPGTIVQIYGKNLANLAVQPKTLPLPTALNGTSVIIGGLEAPLFYVSPTQVNAQVPFELQANQEYQVVLQANGAITTPQNIALSPATPGIASFSDGTVIAQHAADGSLVSQTSPAQSGEYLVTYLVGLGSVNQTVTDGSASPSGTLALPIDPPSLTINGASYPLAFAGLTPGLVGLYQINFQVPVGLTAGNLTLVVTQDANTSNQVFLPYQP